MPLGVLLGGPVAGWAYPPPSILGGGTLTITTTLATAPMLRRIQSAEPAPTPT